MAIFVIDDAHRLDLPHRRLRAAFAVHHGAGGIDGAIHRVTAVAARGGLCSQPAAVVQHQQHVGDGAILQAVGKRNAVTQRLVAGRIGDLHIADGHHLAGLAV